MSLASDNRSALIRCFPRMEREIFGSFHPSGKLTALVSKEGAPAAMLEGKALCSHHDPVREGKRLIEREISPGTGCCVFAGFGLGYTVEPFLERDPDNLAIIVEKDPEIFLKVLELRDFTRLFSSGRISLLIGTPTEAVTDALKEAGIRKIGFLAARYLIETEPDYCRDLTAAVDRFVNRRNININTLKKFGRRWILNLGANLPRYAQVLDLMGLRDKFAGMPALLLAAGPTLENVLPLLPELKKRFLLVSVDTALRSLLRRGISPDIAVVVDPQYWNSRHLDRCQPSETLLVTDSSAFPGVFYRFSPPWIFYRSSFPLAGNLEKGIGLTGRLRGGGSVATAAWEIIRILGCSGVWTAGLDLGYPGKHTHFKGSFFEELRHAISNRFITEENMQWHALHDAAPTFAKDYRDRPILSDQRMAVYRLWFEEQAARYTSFATVNLSQHSCRIAGHTTCDPESLLTFPEIRERIDQNIEEIKSQPRGGHFSETCLLAVERIINQLKEILALATAGEEIARQLLEEWQAGQVSSQKLSRLDRIDRDMMALPGKEIVSFLLQPLIYRITWEGSTDNSPEKTLTETGEIYAGIRESAEFHLKILEKSKKKLM